MERIAGGLVIATLTGCGAIRSQMVRKDYAEVDAKQTADHYAADLGEEVRPYVAPAYHLLKETFDTLPELSDQAGLR